ncbi:P-loop containing nucleoside triphosphate hydrolase protein [Nemania sp. FL0916]|nr:P-loop containing nucleoside triphosphate hydrolase protein [Nemania sp. FL0916]
MADRFRTELLDGLCPEDRLWLLNAVDQLRHQGIDHYISLPQIIVFGDQSSGKSSVLQAISGVPFPVKSNLCTRFPIELILRRSNKTNVTVSIVPHHLSAADPKFSNFRENLDALSDLALLIERAKVAMDTSLQSKGFSKDLLRIEVSGPHHPQLTIVDLPGLIHSETKQQGVSAVELVKDVVQEYMKQPRSIILAVVSAKNDFANQVVLKLARSADPDGERTMGVITKPDTLVEGSESEALFVSLAENKQFEFSLGWHVLRNLDSEKIEGELVLTRRNEEEEAFFSGGIWSTLPAAMLGVQKLRTRLSEILLKQIASELPSLIKEIENKLRDCKGELARMRPPRVDTEQQKEYLQEINFDFQLLVKSAKDGVYTEPFFEEPKTDIGSEQRLRAVIQRLNQEFATQMVDSGHARRIVSSYKTCSHEDITPDNTVSRDDLIEETRDTLKKNRGLELPGSFNSSSIVKTLFFGQSTPWKQIVTDHVDRCFHAVRRCLELVIASISEKAAGERLLELVIRPALGKLKQAITSKADELIQSERHGHPMTYNKSYLETVRRIRAPQPRESQSTILSRFFKQSNSGCDMTSVYLHGAFNLDGLLDQLSPRTEIDEELEAASEAVDRMQAYYEVAIRRIVDGVAIEAIERILLADLHTMIWSAIKRMPEKVISDIAGPSQESQDKRARLENQTTILQNGIETCQRFAEARSGQSDGPVDILRGSC